MQIRVTDEEQAALVRAQQRTRTVREWRRYQAVLLRAQGVAVAAVAQALGCSQTSVCNWTRAWREAGAEGVGEGPHPGGTRRLSAEAEQALEALLEEGDPQAYGHAATGWTVPLLRQELARRGWAASARTLRRVLHRRGWRWKRPKYVLGRPDPDYAAKRGRSWSR